MTNASLVPCGGCRRHVRASDPACPFCATPLATSAGEGIVPEPPQRLSRAGILAFAAAFLSTSCHPQQGPTPPTPNAVDSGMMATIYGGPMPPPTPPTPPPMPDDMAVPAYGAPPPMPPTPPPAPQDAGASPQPAAHPQTPTNHRVHSISTRYGSPPRPTDDLDG
jgi:hypothetical protein